MEASVTVTVSGASPADAEQVIEQVTAKAAELALAELRSIWPERTGRSKAGLSAEANAVVGSAPYTSDVRRRGSSSPIVDSDARDIGQRAAEQASQSDDGISEALDGVITEILSMHLEQ